MVLPPLLFQSEGTEDSLTLEVTRHSDCPSEEVILQKAYRTLYGAIMGMCLPVGLCLRACVGRRLMQLLVTR